MYTNLSQVYIVLHLHVLNITNQEQEQHFLHNKLTSQVYKIILENWVKFLEFSNYWKIENHLVILQHV